MKLFLAILAVISFLALAGFGVFAMDHDGDHSMAEGCVAAMAKPIDCAETSNPFAFLSFHLDFFKSFSKAVFGQGFSALIFIAALALVYLKAILKPPQVLPQLNFAYYFRNSSRPSRPPQREFTQWFSLHENSPSSQ